MSDKITCWQGEQFLLTVGILGMKMMFISTSPELLALSILVPNWDYRKL